MKCRRQAIPRHPDVPKSILHVSETRAEIQWNKGKRVTGEHPSFHVARMQLGCAHTPVAMTYVHLGENSHEEINFNTPVCCIQEDISPHMYCLPS